MTENLEKTVEGSYIISVPKNPDAQEAQKRYKALVERAGQLQQEHGPDFTLTRRYAFTKAVAAEIKDIGLVKLLENEGYIVERQPRVRMFKA